MIIFFPTRGTEIHVFYFQLTIAYVHIQKIYFLFFEKKLQQKIAYLNNVLQYCQLFLTEDNFVKPGNSDF